MILLDVEAGTFAWSRPRPDRLIEGEGDELELKPQPGTLLTQLWAPIDYMTAPFGNGDLTDDTIKAFVMAWTLDESGEEREVEITSDDYDARTAAGDEVLEGAEAEVWDAHARLAAITELPAATPSVIRGAIEERQNSRMDRFRAVAAAAEKAIEDGNLWIHPFGEDAVAGSMEGFANDGHDVVLGKPRPSRGEKDQPRTIRIRSIAAASPFTGKWKRPPENLAEPLFRRFAEETPAALLRPPQLWNSLCPSCRQVARLPWSSGLCWSCRKGEVRNEYSFLTTSLLERLLEGRAEWQKLVVVIEETPAGTWEAAFKTPEGSYVESDDWVEGARMSVERDDRREAVIALTQLADEYSFNLNPEAEGQGSWKALPSA
jgi:hypothetical protein